jgi:hypothetical protein
MSGKRKKRSTQVSSRRRFLQTVGAGIPTLKLLAQETNAEGSRGTEATVMPHSAKFLPIDLSAYFSASPRDFGPRAHAQKGTKGIIRGLSGCGRDGLIRTPAGQQTYRGIPFLLGPEGLSEKRWIVLSTRGGSGSIREVEIPLRQKASFFCLSSFCDWDENEEAPSSDPELAMEKIGQLLGEAALVFEDGSHERLPIRRRFEVNSPSIMWGRSSFSSLPHLEDVAANIVDPLHNGLQWGVLQTRIMSAPGAISPDGLSVATLWICALGNPYPERTVRNLRLEGSAADPLVVCGLTLFRGSENPLRYSRLALYRLTLPRMSAGPEEWKVSVDLGVLSRTFVPDEFHSQAWLSSESKGLGGHSVIPPRTRYLCAELAASPEATLTLQDRKTGKKYLFELGKVHPGQKLEGQPSRSRIEILEVEKVWLHGKVFDQATKRPTSVRLAFRSKEGRYIPPYGHRTDVNDSFLQDYGADAKLMDTCFAYVDGTFQIELPVGEVYLEMTKGFEYEAVRSKLQIKPDQREINLEIERLANFRSDGWVTADTHVHFLSPSTAVFEGQAEGLNLINLLASQWGDLFTNVGDFFQGPLTSQDGETIVQVGTENRQHILGHLGLLGDYHSPIYPMCASGPQESFFGDPVWTSLAEWAERCRKQGDLTIAAHFPFPAAEVAADIVLDKIDAVELRPLYGDDFNNPHFTDWYRCLNCGYRLPAVTGTDKMGAYMPVGATRTYAYLGAEEFNFATWSRAVRAGNTFISSGPLLLFQADGHTPGGEITLGAGGCEVEVSAQAKSFVPFHKLEIIYNGRVVASHEEPNGIRDLTLKDKVRVPGPGWLAARCASRLGPTTNWSLHVLAHTSPIYMHMPGQSLFSPKAAAYLLTLIDASQTWLETLATRPDPERFEKVRKVFLDARERLHKRLHESGAGHGSHRH